MFYRALCPVWSVSIWAAVEPATMLWVDLNAGEHQMPRVLSTCATNQHPSRDCLGLAGMDLLQGTQTATQIQSLRQPLTHPTGFPFNFRANPKIAMPCGTTASSSRYPFFTVAFIPPYRPSSRLRSSSTLQSLAARTDSPLAHETSNVGAIS